MMRRRVIKQIKRISDKLDESTVSPIFEIWIMKEKLKPFLLIDLMLFYRTSLSTTQTAKGQKLWREEAPHRFLQWTVGSTQGKQTNPLMRKGRGIILLEESESAKCAAPKTEALKSWLYTFANLLFVQTLPEIDHYSANLMRIATWLRDDASNWALSWVWTRLKSRFGSRINGPKSRSLPARRIPWHCSWWPRAFTITRRFHSPRRRRSWRCAWMGKYREWITAIMLPSKPAIGHYLC